MYHVMKRFTNSISIGNGRLNMTTVSGKRTQAETDSSLRNKAPSCIAKTEIEEHILQD
jgi:hypothetical protein